MIPKCERCGQPVSWHADAPPELHDQELLDRITSHIGYSLENDPVHRFDFTQSREKNGTKHLRSLIEGRIVNITIALEPRR